MSNIRLAEIKVFKTLLFIFLLSSLPAISAAANLVRAPYLQLVTPDSVTIAWRTDDVNDTAPSQVQYGTDQGNLSQSVTSSSVIPASNTSVRDHFVTLSGLNAETKYYYNVGTTGEVQGGGSLDHYAVTAPLSGAKTAFRAWVLSDSGAGSQGQLDVRDAMLTETNSSGKQDLFFHLGDMAYNDGLDSEFTLNHFDIYQTIWQNTPFYAAFGNHEASSSSATTQTGPYYDAFVLPKSAQAGGVVSNTEAYYSFDYANVHFVVIDSSESSTEPGSPQILWLTNDLASTSQDWIIAMAHHSPYTKGTHNSDDASDSEGRQVKMRENVLHILEAGGVDLVISGHSHAYERSFLINGAYGFGTAPNFVTPDFLTLQNGGHILDSGDGNPAGDGQYTKSFGRYANEGTVYVVNGAGGQTNNNCFQCDHPVMYFGEPDLSSMLLDVDGDMLTISNLRADGAIADTFSIAKLERAPGISAITPIDQNTVELTFDEDVEQTSAEQISNYAIVNGTAITVSNAVLNADQRTVTLTTDALTFDVTYTVTVTGVLDLATPANAANETKTFVLPSDIIPPAIIDITPLNQTTLVVTLSESLNQASVETIANYTIDNGVTVTSAILAADQKTITLVTSTFDLEVLHTLTIFGVLDLAPTPNASNDSKKFSIASLSTDLLAYWNLDEGTGVIAEDLIGNAHQGQLNGAIWSTETDDNSNASLFFNGASAVDIPDPLDAAAGGLTLSVRMKAQNFDVTDARLISKADGGGGSDHYWMLGTFDTAAGKGFRFRLKTGSSTSTLITQNVSLLTDTWYHVAATYDGAFMRIYLDGIEVASLAKTGLVAQAPSVPVSIGQQPLLAGGNKGFFGHLDDVRLYNRSLDPTEVSDLSALGQDVTPAEIIAITPVDNSTVAVVFNEAVDTSSAQTLANYSLDGGISVNSAVLAADQRTVTLGVTPFNFSVSYTLTISNLLDQENNVTN
ncbi:MAG: LamG-like jellyroll fold domain-containing protein, partial [Thiotrichaceae bacterium]